MASRELSQICLSLFYYLMAHLSLFHQGCVPSEDPPQGRTLHPIPTLDMHTHWSPSSSYKHIYLQIYVNFELCHHYLAIF